MRFLILSRCKELFSLVLGAINLFFKGGQVTRIKPPKSFTLAPSKNHLLMSILLLLGGTQPPLVPGPLLCGAYELTFAGLCPSPSIVDE